MEEVKLRSDVPKSNEIKDKSTHKDAVKKKAHPCVLSMSMPSYSLIRNSWHKKQTIKITSPRIGYLVKKVATYKNNEGVYMYAGRLNRFNRCTKRETKL